MTLNLTPETALKLIAFTTADRLDDAQRIADIVNAQRAVNNDPAQSNFHSSLVRVSLQDAEALVSAIRATNLYAGLKLEWPARG